VPCPHAGADGPDPNVGVCNFDIRAPSAHAPGSSVINSTLAPSRRQAPGSRPSAPPSRSLQTKLGPAVNASHPVIAGGSRTEELRE